MAISEITPQIYVSGQMAATLEQVQKLGITYILNVAVESSAIVYPKSIKLEKFDIIDFPTAPISNYFNPLTDKIHAHLNANKQNKVLVHCMAGISRSTTIVCAYLMRYMNMSLRDAYLLCKKHRPICFPNLGFWNQLIAYENQLKKEISVKMIPTQFGNVPDIAFEEIKQLRALQQQQGGLISLPVSSLVSTNNNPVNSSNTPSETISNQTRSTTRDSSVNQSNGLARSRSLASKTSVAAASTYVSNPAYQTPLFATNKQSFFTPTRFGVSRLLTSGIPNNNSIPPAPSTSSTSYASNRSLPISTAPNIKHRHTNNNHHHHHNHNHNHPPTVLVNSATTTNNDQRRPHYETTYRASFIKPLAP